MKPLAFFFSLLITQMTLATGGTYCLVNDDNISLEANLVNGRFFGNPVVAGEVAVQIKKDSLVVGLTSYNFKKEEGEIPYWFNLNDELKLGAYAEPSTDQAGNPIDAWVSMSVVLDTMYVEGTDGPGFYIGKYTVTQSSYVSGPGHLTKSFEGSVKCEIE